MATGESVKTCEECLRLRSILKSVEAETDERANTINRQAIKIDKLEANSQLVIEVWQRECQSAYDRAEAAELKATDTEMLLQNASETVRREEARTNVLETRASRLEAALRGWLQWIHMFGQRVPVDLINKSNAALRGEKGRNYCNCGETFSAPNIHGIWVWPIGHNGYPNEKCAALRGEEKP